MRAELRVVEHDENVTRQHIFQRRELARNARKLSLSIVLSLQTPHTRHEAGAVHSHGTDDAKRLPFAIRVLRRALIPHILCRREPGVEVLAGLRGDTADSAVAAPLVGDSDVLSIRDNPPRRFDNLLALPAPASHATCRSQVAGPRRETMRFVGEGPTQRLLRRRNRRLSGKLDLVPASQCLDVLSPGFGILNAGHQKLWRERPALTLRWARTPAEHDRFVLERQKLIHASGRSQDEI